MVFSAGLSVEEVDFLGSRLAVVAVSLVGRIVDDGGGDVVGDSGVEALDTPLNIPNDRDSFRASRDPSLSSPNASKARCLNSSVCRRTYTHNKVSTPQLQFKNLNKRTTDWGGGAGGRAMDRGGRDKEEGIKRKG